MHRYVGVLFALLAALHVNIQVLAAGNIGCLFSDTLCEQEREWCFDDHAFGHCLPHYGHITEEDLHRFDLGSDELRLLEQEMQRLFHLGYRWSHTYTQCVLQELLHAIRRKVDFDISSCNGDVDQDLEGALRAIEGEELVDPRNLAIVQFTPSATDPHSDYADEIYYPPIKDQLLQGHALDDDDDNDVEDEDHHDDPDADAGADGNRENNEVHPADTSDHQESHASEPGESMGRNDGGGVGGVGGGGGGDGGYGGFDHPDDPHDAPFHPSYYHPMGGMGPYPGSPSPEEDNSMNSFPAGGSMHPSSPHDRPPLPPPYDPRQQNYIPYYGSDDMEDYDDEIDTASSYRSPYHYQAPMNPVYRKRASPDDTQGPFLANANGKLTLAELRGIANLLQNFDAAKPYLSETEDEMEGEEDGVFGEGPARPMYSEAGLQFIPDIEENGDFPENAAREAILSNMPQDLHTMPEGFRSIPDDYRNMPDLLDGIPPESARDYRGSYQSAIDSLRNSPWGLDVLPDEAYKPMGAAEPQDYRPVEPLRLDNSILRSLYMPDSKPLEVNDQELPWDRLMLDDFDDEDEEEALENTLPRSSGKINALHEAFGPQLSSIRNFGEDEDGDDYNDDYPEYGGIGGEGGGVGGRLLDEYGDYGQFDGGDARMVLPRAFPFLQKLDKKDEERAGDDYDDMFEREWSFKRPERDDVKKPGPGFGVNAFSFGDDYPLVGDGDPIEVNLAEIQENYDDVLRKMDQPGEDDSEEMPDVVLAEEGIVDDASDEGSSDPKMERRQDTNGELDVSSTAPPSADPAMEFEGPDSYVYITVSGKFKTDTEAYNLAVYVMKLSGLTKDDIVNFNDDESQVRFQVRENARGLTSSDVVRKAKEMRGQVEADTGLSISQAGLGNKTTMSALVFSSSEKHILAAAAIVCGVMAALLVAASVLFFLRRHAKSKAKLLGLTAHDTEASKDYQDLCRARMAGKGGSEGGKGDPPTTTHVKRISSLPKDSDNGNNSPSSRSSTSSCEEPVASNMDISTGHMVLSYMEDHLKNKDRLEQEWIALCAYEAEPCATTLAMKPENSKKNRYPDSVPYDHNRVVLNSHANVNGSDYINASSITDHDPRNPAYIATQGPLSATAADFWQLVWEQGSVVIVMLTRLTENGLAFCHRYWPEEGSDLYHIYEVHLVSEHIWCDDYLVRSFYLKNVKTGETRTVTQFHFLSWPDSGTPASTKALLEFRRKVNKSYRGRSCPIIVHCSDGIGRTGTYCLIDMVLNRMAKGAKEIDIAATLEHIRDQRPHMVKSKAQFEFVLMAVAEEVHAILKALPQ